MLLLSLHVSIPSFSGKKSEIWGIGSSLNSPNQREKKNHCYMRKSSGVTSLSSFVLKISALLSLGHDYFLEARIGRELLLQSHSQGCPLLRRNRISHGIQSFSNPMAKLAQCLSSGIFLDGAFWFTQPKCLIIIAYDVLAKAISVLEMWLESNIVCVQFLDRFHLGQLN